MYDRETGSLWSQVLGRAVAGPKRGAALPFIPSVTVTWAAWQDEHPNTKFLDTGSLARPYNFYDQYYADPDMVGAYGENNPDRRFHPKDIVLGVVVGEHARAYSSRDLFGDAVINDTLGKMDIVAVHEERSGVTAVFDRSAAGRTLTFKRGDEPLQMIDEQTGSVWNKLNGQAIAGPLHGHLLSMIRSFHLFWFAWSDFYPDTTTYRE